MWYSALVRKPHLPSWEFSICKKTQDKPKTNNPDYQRKPGGSTEENNLAYACSYCKCNKGSDIDSIVFQTEQFSRFFNPRIDLWENDFRLEGAKIVTLTTIGEVTARILDFNHVDRLIERQELAVLGQYPSPDALMLIAK